MDVVTKTGGKSTDDGGTALIDVDMGECAFNSSMHPSSSSSELSV